ncbi:DUF2782 domain-containing protein [Wenzhouxiangella sp. AB-CW3]|uniref:DUF2782 domain-containing protein n=1 Tax=Wenzhouxiangella sp. AB-CW3 TaxID=2771012 RepID=UPI00168C0A9F|nr:DUF2782 domain-containing protein [Wenzhouxiangella sp. AB-CW3]QOC22931.1 DUF2782 domain-containing protein [Wenzhouxiangella sp. AB-CW3]
MFRLIALLAALSMTASTYSATGDEPPESDAASPPPIPEHEPLPPKVQDPDEMLEPQVVIRREDDRIIEEYHAGGVVYMIRIVPAVGPPYYLIDTTGDGNFDSRHEHMEPVRPAHWKIFEW